MIRLLLFPFISTVEATKNTNASGGLSLTIIGINQTCKYLESYYSAHTYSTAKNSRRYQLGKIHVKNNVKKQNRVSRKRTHLVCVDMWKWLKLLFKPSVQPCIWVLKGQSVSGVLTGSSCTITTESLDFTLEKLSLKLGEQAISRKHILMCQDRSVTCFLKDV